MYSLSQCQCRTSSFVGTTGTNDDKDDMQSKGVLGKCGLKMLLNKLSAK